MYSKIELIKKLSATIHTSIEQGLVLVTIPTEQGQMVAFYDLTKDDYEDEIPEPDAFYSYEINVAGQVTDDLMFNPNIY